MNKVGLFSVESNSERIITMFRTLINRKIDNDEIMELAVMNLKKGHRRNLILKNDQHYVLSEVFYLFYLATPGTREGRIWSSKVIFGSFNLSKDLQGATKNSPKLNSNKNKPII